MPLSLSYESSLSTVATATPCIPFSDQPSATLGTRGGLALTTHRLHPHLRCCRRRRCRCCRVVVVSNLCPGAVRPIGGCVSPLAVKAKEEGWLAASHVLAGGPCRDAAPADGVHRDAAPADGGVRWDAAPALGGRLGWSAPIIGPVGWVVGAAAPFGGPCLAAGPPAARVVVVRVILDEDFGLGVTRIIDAVPPFDGSECLLPVKVVEGRILLVSRLLAGARGPARELRLAHPAVELGGVRGVLAPEVVQDFWGLETAGGLSSLLFSCRRGHSHCACGAAISRVHPKDLERRVDAWRGLSHPNPLLPPSPQPRSSVGVPR
jgi:hypothetical protein